MGSGIIARLRPWLLGLGLGCMVIYLVRERTELARLLAGADNVWLLASLPVALIGNGAVASLFGQLLSGYGVVIGKSRLYPLFFYSNLAKYIPGRVWSMLYQHLSLPTTTARPTVVLVNLDLTVWQLTGCGILALFLGYYHAPLAAAGLAECSAWQCPVEHNNHYGLTVRPRGLPTQRQPAEHDSNPGTGPEFHNQ